jgi:hypothetical protein
MISVKGANLANASILVYANETLLVNDTVTYNGFGDLWPFSRAPDVNPGFWTIGGVDTNMTTPGPTEMVPQIIGGYSTLVVGGLSDPTGQYRRGPAVYERFGTPVVTEMLAIPGPPTVPGNIPITGTPGEPGGFVCQGLTELWVVYGNYVDWTNAKNRAHFHKFDSGSGKYVPVDLGAKGQKPTGSPPWLYLTGGPNQFSTNRANGNTLTVSGALLESEVSWPPQVG